MLKIVKQAIEALIAHGYAIIHKDNLSLTDKVLELDMKAIEAKPPPYTKSLTVLDPITKSVIPTPGQQSQLVAFIMECQIPQKIHSADGSSYWANKYSKEAEKELQKLLNQGYQYDILVAATKLYYKSGDFCEAISNYLVRGTWLTHYLEMEKQLKAGTVEKHIKDNIQVTGGTPLSDDL